MVLRSILLYLAKQHRLKDVFARVAGFKQITRRFIAGENIADAIAAVQELNRLGMSASFDHLGESITSRAEAENEVTEYFYALSQIQATQTNANVSVKLTQLGLDFDEEFCLQNARRIVAEAARYNNFVRIDMEDSSKTDATLRIIKTLRHEFENVGAVIQAYLYRSEKDVADLLQIGSRIRLCKGAYDEPESVALSTKQKVDENFVKLLQQLLPSGVYHGIATHDEAMIEAAKKIAAEKNIPQDQFEFQMLYGIRRDLQIKLIQEGYRVRIYVPYGEFWYPYFMRRLAERPANVWFVLKSLFKG